MTFEETLKAKGFTEADLNDPTMKPILERFRPTLEEAWGERDQLRTQYDSYKNEVETQWTPNVNQRIAAAEQEAVQARRLAADYQEQVKIARDYGFIDDKTNPNPNAPAKPQLDPANSPFDPKVHNLITRDDVVKFADIEGDAMVQMQDLGEEYRQLTGKSLYDYTNADGTARGLTALRREAIQNRRPVFEYVREKFGFRKLREDKAAEAQKLREDAIRKEAIDQTKMEMANQYGNPNMRTSAPSRQPFIPARKEGAGMPWEKTAGDKKNNRIERAMQSQMRQSIQ